MPKVEYTSSKGLIQTTGSGFSVGDVPVVENIEEVTTAGATTLKAYGTSLVTTGGAHNITVPAGSYAGQKKLVVLSVAGGNGSLLAETDGADDDNDEAFGTMTAAGDFALLMWIGDRWVTLASQFT